MRKLIKVVHFLAAHNLPVKELYPKLVSFLANDIKEPVVKQYLDACKKSEVNIDKIKIIRLSERGIDISRTWFVCFDGTNVMSSEKAGVQQRYWCKAPFSIYVNCWCHRLALCFKHLVNKFPWLSEIDRLLLWLWKTFHYSSLNCHIFFRITTNIWLATFSSC